MKKCCIKKYVFRMAFIFLIFSATFFCCSEAVMANDIEKNSNAQYEDYADIQTVIDDSDSASDLSFKDIVGRLVSGNADGLFWEVGEFLYKQIFEEIDLNRRQLLQVTGLALLGAVFTNFSAAFAGNYVSGTGFYITCLVLFSLLLTSFKAAFAVAQGMLEFLVDFMGALLPAFCGAIAFASGTSSASGFYGVMAMAILAVDWLICKGILRLIQIYLILSLADQLARESYLSKLCELIRTIVMWTLKTMMGLTVGLNLIQAMVLPAFDSFKNSAFMRISSVIPGVGNALNTAAKTAIGSGILIKNAIGAGGFIVIVVICAVPLLKLLIIVLMYKLTEAVAQPVSDHRIIDSIHSASDSVFMLFMAAGSAMLLFVLSLAIIASASNLAMGGG